MCARSRAPLLEVTIAAWLAGCAPASPTPVAPASPAALRGGCFRDPAQFARALLDAAKANDAAAWDRLQAPRHRLPPGLPDHRFAQWRRELLASEGALRNGPVRIHRDTVYEYLVAGPSEELTMVVTHLDGCLLLNDN